MDISSLIGICLKQDQYQLFYLAYPASGGLVITPNSDWVGTSNLDH